MQKRDIIVIGGSAGGIDACCEVLQGLPGDFPAAVFIVQHIGPATELAKVFNRCGSLQVITASQGAAIRRRRAYVAPSGQHLLIEDGHIRLSKGARENGQRPSVDALFRSGSRAYRSRVIAVVLSGTLWDGAAGVYAVKQRGGLVVVQDPSSTIFPSMPESALKVAKPDYCVPVPEIAPLLIKLVSVKDVMPMKRRVSRRAAKNKEERNVNGGGAAPFVCPECSGPLFQDPEGPRGQVKCLVGHSFAPESLTELHRDALERTLFTAMRMLRERAAIHRHLAAKNNGSGRRGRFEEDADAESRDEKLLREILERI